MLVIAYRRIRAGLCRKLSFFRFIAFDHSIIQCIAEWFLFVMKILVFHAMSNSSRATSGCKIGTHDFTKNI